MGDPPQNHKPRGVSDPVQPLQRFLAAPAHPTVPRRTAEGARLPARSAHPPPASGEYGAQTSTRKRLETKIMMAVHHTVPATHLIRTRQAHHHIPERKTLRGRLENIRGALQDNHGYHTASQTASTHPNHLEPTEPSLPTNLAWDGSGVALLPFDRVLCASNCPDYLSLNMARIVSMAMNIRSGRSWKLWKPRRR